MLTLDELSRACATICIPEPVPSFTQKLEELSVTEFVSDLTTNEYWPEPFTMRSPKLPARAAAPVTDVVPLPGTPLQEVRSPDSKPSANSSSVYPIAGVSGGVATDGEPVPIAFVAATVNV